MGNYDHLKGHDPAGEEEADKAASKAAKPAAEAPAKADTPPVKSDTK